METYRQVAATCFLFSLALHVQHTRAFSSVLLYVPLHAKPGAAEQLKSLYEATLSKHPFQSFTSPYFDSTLYWLSSPVYIDILVVVSGTDTKLIKRIRRTLSKLLQGNASYRKIYFERTDLGNEAYDRTQSSATWTKGPNDVFFEVFAAGGKVYEGYTRHYDFVHQLETDVVALKQGWLAAALGPMYDERVVVSGTSVNNWCMWSEDRKHPCFPSDRISIAAVRNHINGNALYRPSYELQQLLEVARANFTSAAFDVAIWLAAAATDHIDWLWDNDHVASPFIMVPADPGLALKAFPDYTYLAHVPRRFRADVQQLKAWCSHCLTRGDFICRSRWPAQGICIHQNL